MSRFQKLSLLIGILIFLAIVTLIAVVIAKPNVLTEPTSTLSGAEINQIRSTQLRQTATIIALTFPMPTAIPD